MADGCKGPKHYWVHWVWKKTWLFPKLQLSIAPYQRYNGLAVGVFGGMLVWNRPGYSWATVLSFALAGGELLRYKQDKPGATGVQQPRYYVVCLHPLVVAYVPNGPPLVVPEVEGAESAYSDWWGDYNLLFPNRVPALSGLTESQARRLTCRKIAVLARPYRGPLPYGWGDSKQWREFWHAINARRVFITFRKPRTVYSIIVSQPWKRLTER